MEVTLLDCIERVPSITKSILENRDATFAPLLETLGGRLNALDEIILIGSGTSNTAAVTARYFTERASGLRTTVLLPNEYLYDLTVRNENALYLFISQTGTSIVVTDCLQYAKQNGCFTAVLSEAATTPLAQMADCFIDMGCGYEEHPTRTIGYSASVLSIQLMGLALGRARGFLPQAQYDEYIRQAQRLPVGIEAATAAALSWMRRAKRTMLRSTALLFTGAGALYGVALEGAVKAWELPQTPSMGYELEEGIHGPNFGYNQNHCVIVLNDGGRENKKALGLARYMKNEWKTGFVVGLNPLDETDLAFTPASGTFAPLEFAAVVQVISYVLAHDSGRDLSLPHDNSVMYSYFKGHSDYKGKDEL